MVGDEKHKPHGDRVKACVGITTSLDPGERLRRGVDYVYLKRSYPRAVREAGAVPLLLTPEVSPSEALATCDALVISGGDDLPNRFGEGEALAARTDAPEQAERIAWERRLLQTFAEAERHVLGVCYGMQLMNLHFGGSLDEDLAAARPDALDHGGAGRFTEHDLVRCGAHPALDPVVEPVRVSSSHRQGIAELAPGFEVVARAPDGVPEAIARGPLLGVEWHPEADATGRAIYGWLVRASAERGSFRPARRGEPSR